MARSGSGTIRPTLSTGHLTKSNVRKPELLCSAFRADLSYCLREHRRWQPRQDSGLPMH
jgi:hypothetical protein